MDLQQFRAKVYSIISGHGYIEHRGQLYFPESAIMDALEFFYHEVKNLPIDQFESKILAATRDALNQLYGNSHGFGEEKQDRDGDGCGCDDFFDGGF